MGLAPETSRRQVQHEATDVTAGLVTLISILLFKIKLGLHNRQNTSSVEKLDPKFLFQKREHGTPDFRHTFFEIPNLETTTGDNSNFKSFTPANHTSKCTSLSSVFATPSARSLRLQVMPPHRPRHLRLPPPPPRF